MEDEIQYKSKTVRKKEADALQKLGLQLAELSVPQLNRIDIPKELRAALIEGKSITSNVAARRHRQFIGVLMRDMDPESARKALYQAQAESPAASAPPDESQNWMSRLLDGGPEEMEAFLSLYPEIERQRLRQLLRNVNKESALGKSSKSRKLLEELILTALGR